MTGTSASDAFGLRFDAGFKVNPVLALGLRIEDLRLRGSSAVSVRTANGPVNVARDIDSERSYLQAKSILRLGREQLAVLPAGVQVGGMAESRRRHRERDNVLVLMVIDF